MKVHGIVWVGVRTDAFDDTLAFFRDVLGVPLSELEPGFGWSRMPNTSQLEIFGPGDRDHRHFTTGPVPEFLVDDLPAALDELRAAGVEILGAPVIDGRSGWCHFRAPDGNVYGLTAGEQYFRPGRAAASSEARKRPPDMSGRSVLVIAAHPGDFVWRAGGAIALATSDGDRAVIACLSYGERGESAKLWREGATVEQVKAARRAEGEAAAAALGAEIEFFDAGDYPLIETPELVSRLVRLYRSVQPDVVLTHGMADPYNDDHPTAGAIARRARQYAQAAGVPGPGEVIGAPPVFTFEPHQPEQCGFVPDVLLDVTPVWDRKLAAMECFATQRHLWEYYTDLGRRRGVQAARNSGPNLGLPVNAFAEAFERNFPQVVRRLE